jgi:TPR repeat protein
MKRNWTNEPILKFKVMAIPPYIKELDENKDKELHAMLIEDCAFFEKMTRGKLWKRAVFWYKKAALQNEPFAVQAMKRMESFKVMKRKAKDGDKDAQYLLALYYFYSYGHYEDYDEGCKWMRKAVLNGSKEAIQSFDEWKKENYGMMDNEIELIDLELIERGLKDDDLFLPPIVIPEGLDLRPYHMDVRHGIMKWRFASENHTDKLWHEFSKFDFKETLRAAEEGNAEKQYQLAWLYEWGRETSQDNLKAIEWFVRAAYNGYAPAQTELGILYQYNICGMSHSLTDHDYELRKSDSADEQNQ